MKDKRDKIQTIYTKEEWLTFIRQLREKTLIDYLFPAVVAAVVSFLVTWFLG